MDPEKVQAVEALGRPENLKSLRTFLGMTGYYRKYISKYATIAAPLITLTMKDQSFNWGKQQESAYELLKHKRCTAPILRRFRPDLAVTITCDASLLGVASCLQQKEDKQEWVVAYAS